MFGKKGLFGIGGGRLARDERRLMAKEGEKGYIKNDAKRAYIAQAVAGNAMNEGGYDDESGYAGADRAIARGIDELSEGQ